jgi:hypothetical protein
VVEQPSVSPTPKPEPTTTGTRPDVIPSSGWHKPGDHGHLVGTGLMLGGLPVQAGLLALGGAGILAALWFSATRRRRGGRRMH